MIAATSASATAGNFVPSPKQTPWPDTTRTLRIGELSLDLVYRRLSEGGHSSELPQRVFDLLLLFLAEPYRLHTRDALFERLWPDVVVEDANLSQSIWLLRRALGDTRKSWIRTVAKRGYVFEPAGAVVAIGETEHPGAASPPIVASPAIAGPPDEISANEARSATVAAYTMPAAAAVPAHPRRRRRIAWVAASVLAAVVLLVVVVASSRQQPASEPVRIALIDVADSGADPNSRWPTLVAHTWIEWKLSAIPEITVLGAADLAAESAAAPPVDVILLSTSIGNAGASRVRLRAQRSRDALAPIEVEGNFDDVAALIDTLSTQLLAELVPSRAHESWPALALDRATAELYAAALPEREQQRSAEFIARIGPVIERAPQFALARMQRAQSLRSLGQMAAARSDLDAAAAAWMARIPGDAAAVLAAQRLALGSDDEATAAAYARLRERFPAQPRFLLEHARVLSRMGRNTEAIEQLQSLEWQHQPVLLRVTALLRLADAQLVIEDADGARSHAQEAARLAEQASLTRTHAYALLTIADAEALVRKGPEVTALFERAAQRFESTGDSLNVLIARLSGQIADPAASPDALDALLAQAHSAGHTSVEIDYLRRAAFKHFFAGEIMPFRRRLDQVAALAQEYGQRAPLRAVEFDRANEAFLQTDLAGARARTAHLLGEPALGGMGSALAFLAASVDIRAGDYAAALAVLDRAAAPDAPLGRLRGSAAVAATALTACPRGAIALARGETAVARINYTACAAATDSTVAAQGELGLARLALLGGDYASAAARLSAISERIANFSSQPDRWLRSTELAALMLRTGQVDRAETLLEQLLPLVTTADYRLLRVDTLIGLAECALARGDTTAAQRHARQARAIAARDDWSAEQRLLPVEAVVQRASGELVLAGERIAALDAGARAHADIAAELLAHSVAKSLSTELSCPLHRTEDLLVRSGLRGINGRWLLGAPAAIVQRNPAPAREQPPKPAAELR